MYKKNTIYTQRIASSERETSLRNQANALLYRSNELQRKLDLKKKLVDFLIANQQLTTPQFKEMTGVSRKFLIPLIEYFDSKNITIRIGDIRKLRKTG